MNQTHPMNAADPVAPSLNPPSASPAAESTSSSPPAPAPGESPRAFEAFCAYLELGPRRRLSTVAGHLGVSLRTIQRWATRFDWRTRIHRHSSHAAEQFVQAQDDERVESAAREKSLRDRQIILAEAVLDVTERYFERLDDMALDQVRLLDACRALEMASRLVNQQRNSDTATTPDHGLRDQLAALLDQAFGEQTKPACQ